MNPRWMQDRFVAFTKYEVAKLPGYEVVFNIDGTRGTAIANLCPKADNVVYGILYTLGSHDEDFSKLDEALANEKGILFAETVYVAIGDEDWEVPAVIYIAKANTCNPYLSRIEKSYFDEFVFAANLLPIDYIETLHSFKNHFALIYYKVKEESLIT